MSNILVVTVGNRDVQFKIDNISIGNEIIKLKENTKEDQQIYIFENQILDNSKKVFEYLEDYSFVEIPIIKILINKLDSECIKIDKIVLICSNNNHNNDTYYFGKIIKKKLSNYNVEIREMNFNPMELKNYNKFIDSVFNEKDKFFIECSGGIPQTRIAIYLYSIFRDNLEIYEVSKNIARKESKIIFEKVILKNKIISALEKYNYNFIREYKYKFGKDFKNIFDEINSVFTFSKKYKNEDLILEFEEKLNDLLSHLIVQWKSNNTSSFLGEFYSFIQNMGYYLIIKIAKFNKKLEGKKIYYKDEKKLSIKNIFFNKLGELVFYIYPELVEKNNKIVLKDSFINKTPTCIDNASIESLDELFKKLKEIIKNSKLEKQLNEYNDLVIYFSDLKSFRNNCIVSHSLSGYTKQEILDKLNITDDEMFKKLIKYFEIICSRKFINFFDEKNKKLLDLLN